MGKRKFLFELVDHCCSVCGGRILLRTLPNGHQQVRCAECEATAETAPTARAPYEALCFCGVKLAGGADAGLRCRRSSQTSPERPQEVVVVHIPKEQERHSPVTGPRPVRIGSTED